ncbi:MAG: restriction endonuclease, partial [Proteobacteria bacterium]|nr:restriction endonuclease [Pseudomonadota bacterium]
MDLVAMLPWWVGVVLALASYLLLHSVASQQVVATTQPGQVGAMVTQTLWKTLAGVGQYILPILCLAGAGMSAWRRRARQNLVTDVAQSKAIRPARSSACSSRTPRSSAKAKPASPPSSARWS